MRWAILTPERCVRWDGERLAFGPGRAARRAPPADAGEALWLTYYQSIFNPARLKLAMMQEEMPRKYWANLPEAALIDPLAAGAAERSLTMVQRDPPRADAAHPGASTTDAQGTSRRPAAKRRAACRPCARRSSAAASARSASTPRRRCPARACSTRR